jgi:glutathione S-transferase
MEPILVYGHPLGSSMGLIAAFEWLGQPYRLARVKMVEELLTDDFERLNGRQETPVLVTPDRQVITETMAIASWLEQQDAERRISFVPGTPAAHTMHQLIGFLNTGFTGAFSPLWCALEMAQPQPEYQAALRRFGREQVNDRHRRLEAMLTDDARYLQGDRTTLADAIFVGVARWADFHEAIAPGDYPRIERLKDRLHQDPSVRFACQVEQGEEPTGTGALRGHIPLRELFSLTR